MTPKHDPRIHLFACLSLVAACGVWGCAIDAPETEASTAAPLAGLYTPGNTLGASDPSDLPMARLSDRCLEETEDEDEETGSADEDAGTEPMPMAKGTRGELVVQYKTRTVMQYYAPRHCTAVWIEDAAGQYVATLELNAALRRYAMVYWQERACTDEKQLGPDVTTAASRKDHEDAHSLSWSGLDALERPVPDGTYTLWIEVTETDFQPGLVDTFQFEKGPGSYSMPLPVSADGHIAELNIAWTPE